MKRYLFGLVLFVLAGCSTSGPGFLARKSPHEQYAERLERAGLQQTALGRAWFQAATASLNNPLRITLPYRETGYFGAERPSAVGLRFTAKRGQLLKISLQRNPGTAFQVYYDLWKPGNAGQAPQRLAIPDTTTLSLEYEVQREEELLLRLQPELLATGEYTLTIAVNPALAYPVVSPDKHPIKSYWGADRDAGARRHEGIDIFAPRRTPAVAAAAGTIERVNENTLGGKVVWLRPDGKDYVLYYAHLDSQIARNGQEVRLGDTVGLVGNTGNARTTPPHLHFGIYALGGAVDPFPFVNPRVPEVPDVKTDTKVLGRWLTTARATNVYRDNSTREENLRDLPRNTPVQVLTATGTLYRVLLPNDSTGFIIAAHLQQPRESTLVVPRTALLHVAPDSASPRTARVEEGVRVQVLGDYENFRLVRAEDGRRGWMPVLP